MAETTSERLIGNNPFSEEDPRHDIWVSVNRVATEEWERFQGTHPMPSNSETWVVFNEWKVAHVNAKFAIQAKWSCQIYVWDYETADQLRGGLGKLLEYYLAAAEKSRQEPYRRQHLVSELRVQLGQTQHFWNAEAYRLAREREKALSPPTPRPMAGAGTPSYQAAFAAFVQGEKTDSPPPNLTVLSPNVSDVALQSSAAASLPFEEEANDVVEGIPKTRSRLNGTIGNHYAVRKMEAFWESKGILQREFAVSVGTTERTLRSFRRRGKIRSDLFDSIVLAMGTTKEALLAPE